MGLMGQRFTCLRVFLKVNLLMFATLQLPCGQDQEGDTVLTAAGRWIYLYSLGTNDRA